MALLRLSDSRLYTDYVYYAERFSASAAHARPARIELLRYHCFWNGPLTWHHELCLKSLLVTQSAPVEVWFWATPQTIAANQTFLDALAGPRLHIRTSEPASLAADTPLEGHLDLFRGNIEAISDVLRTLVLLKYGGIYFDLDVLFLKDLRPLTGVPFIYPWSNQSYGNSAVMHFRQRAPDLEALAARAATIGTCHPRRLLEFEALEPIVEDLQVWPVFVFDPAWIAHDTHTPINDYSLNLRQFFMLHHPMSLDTFYPSSYAYHWHNGWSYELDLRSIAGQLYGDVCARFAAQTAQLARQTEVGRTS